MMKKLRLIALVLTLAMVTMIAPAAATPDVKVKVNGQLLTFPDQKPYIDQNNRTMVPVRTPMEAIGCKVEWDEKARKAVISKDGKVAEFTIGSKTYVVNGTKKTMDTKAVIVGNRTAFPIRFAAEAMGANVGWDADTYTVLITTVQAPKIQPIEGVKYDPPKNEHQVTLFYVSKWNPEKIENACAVFASVTGETALAEEMKIYIMESYNSNTPMLKTFIMNDGRKVTVLTPRGSKDFEIVIEPK